jgi:predicted DNA-binding protein
MVQGKQKQMDTAITFVLTRENKARIKNFAQSENRTASNWVRTVIEAELRRRESLQQTQEQKPSIPR